MDSPHPSQRSTVRTEPVGAAAQEPASGACWAWIPSLYVAEGLPYALAMSVSVVLYKNLGVSNAAIGFYTAWLYLPWVIKPLWSPVVDMLATPRRWIWVTQLFSGAALAGVALTIPAAHFLQLTLALFWLLAFNSATHDIAADGFYILALSEGDQALFSGIRSTFYKVAIILAQGELVILAGEIQARTGSFVSAWAICFGLAAAVLICLGGWHGFILPQPLPDRPDPAASKRFLPEFFRVFGAFFKKPGVGLPILFLLVYRLGEAQLVRMAPPFLLDPRSAGGLGLSDGQVGFIYGILGVGALLLGGLLGGWAVSRHGLKSWLWPMLGAIHLPDAVFIWLAFAQPRHLPAIAAGLALEQFGYGFGFTAFMLYMIYMARGEHATAHYAICTGFMALGMMVPGMWSGWLQEWMGYRLFFVWVILATIPSFWVAAKIPLDPEFGRKRGSEGRPA